MTAPSVRHSLTASNGAIEDLYHRIQLSPETRRQIEDSAREHLTFLRKETNQEIEALTKTTQRRGNALNADIADDERILLQALDFSTHCGRAYTVAPPHIRRMLNQIFFEKIYVFSTPDNQEIQAAPTFTPPFQLIYGNPNHTLETQEKEKSDRPGKTRPTADVTNPFGSALHIEGLTMTSMVGLTRFELATP